ncbi:asparagine synthase-related protein [Arthrobacter sp. efr-133-R2A-120]|uniref:asparagine synthase-related protein n=1 Tax=Arthrobacter sp. efr-133-R2A-120 TaxID=3040277 RepID=UPI0025505124|nr:asparagine synthase-related protein [Arthrobacter sp. efr-133-R2A-120]
MIRGFVGFDPASVELTARNGEGSRGKSGSWVEYYDHPALTVVAERAGFLLRLLVVRHHSGSASLSTSGYLTHLAKARAEFTEYVSIVVERDGAVTLETGPLALVPVYVALDARGVHFSWMLEDLVTAGLSGKVDVERAKAYIAGKQRYESSTIFQNIKLLSERSSVRATPSGMQQFLPDDALSLEPRDVVAEADVCGAYISLFGAVLASQFRENAAICLELSGGFDSSNVALATAQAGLSGLRSYGLIFPGDAGKHQSARRDAVIRELGATDSATPVEGEHFLDSWLTGSQWVNPYEEIYRQLVETGLEAADLGPSAVMLTGIGGDEALLPRVRQRPYQSAESAEAPPPQRPPKAAVPETALLAANARAPMFMSRGVWPSNPYCSREMIEFSERLPDVWKQSRFIQRKALERWGLESSTLERPVPENFESVLRAEIARVQPLVPKLPEPTTVGLGICSKAEWDRLVRPSLATEDLQTLNHGFRTLTLELSLQSVY